MTDSRGEAPNPDFVVVGHVSKPHGTKGELYVWPLTDRVETTFAPGIRLLVAGGDGDVPDESRAPLLIRSVRPYRRGVLVFFESVGDRDAAERLRDRYLLRPFGETDPLADGEIFYHQLLGMTVLTTDGTEVGKVREVYSLRPADLLEVVGSERSHLIPFTREIVTEWDLARGRVVIQPPPGLLDL